MCNLPAHESYKMHFNKSILFILFLSLFALSRADEVRNFTIVEMSDLHSFIAGKLHKDNQGTLGQVIQFYETIKMRNPNTYFISSGDNHQGTALSDAETPMPGVTNVELLFDYLGQDFISGVGNHDIQGKHPEWLYTQSHKPTGNYFGDRYIATGLKIKNVPTNTETDYLTAKRWTFRSINGIKVMFFSILDKDWATYPTWLMNEEPIATLDAEFQAALNAEKPDLLIDLIHAGAYTDYAKTKQLEWIQQFNKHLRDISGAAIPILNLHGHDHQVYNDTCHQDGSDPLPNCYLYDVRANFQQIGVINVSLSRPNESTPYTMTTSRDLITNTVPQLAKYLGVEKLGCNKTCTTVNDKIVDLATRVGLLDVVAFTDQEYAIPRGDTKWDSDNSTYGLFFKQLSPKVYGNQPFYVCPSGMMKGGLPKGEVIRNNLFSYAAYDNKMVHVTGVTPKVLWGLIHLTGTPDSEDPSTWNPEPTNTKDTFYVWPYLNTSKADDVYDLWVSDYDITHILNSCARFGVDCKSKVYEQYSNRDLIHDAIMSTFPIPEVDSSDVENKTKMPVWGWVLIALAVAIAAGIIVGSFMIRKKNASMKTQV